MRSCWSAAIALAIGNGLCTDGGQCSAESCQENSCGVFVGLVRQPDLGLRYFDATAGLVFAELVKDHCVEEYSVSCASGILEVRAQGCSGAFSPTPVGQTWELCAQGARLNVLQPLIDLTFDAALESPTAVDGCVRLTPAEALQGLSAVRGSLQGQISALAARKAEVGGCPTWLTPQDAIARGDDFRVAGFALSLAVREYQRHLVHQAMELRNGLPKQEALKSFALLGAIIALKDFKNTEAYLAFTKANCGVAVPLGVGIMAPARFASAADVLEDPTQQRVYVGPWASGVSEMCFHPTLPLFLSSGSPEHTQTRMLWDAVGLASMHEGDFEDLPHKTSWLRMARNLLGLREPSEDEVAQLIVPLLVRRVFKKVPTESEAAAFAEYAVYGKLCIKSAMMSELPFLPWKIRSIRSALLQFALSSPVAQSISQLLEAPDYSELRSLYASHASGKPIIELALQNLADATLFAGLVGTTDMTWKCVKNQFRDDAHVRMFRRSPIDYLWELMRLQPAVQGFVSVLRESRTIKLFGGDVSLPAGTPYKLSNSMANRDPAVFPAPSNFDPDRPWEEMGEMLSWNGKLRHVIARNYTAAPRHCPGHDLSVKIAEKVCFHLTQALPAWGIEVKSENRQDPAETNAARPAKPVPPRGRTLDEELGTCPSFMPSVIQAAVSWNTFAYKQGLHVFNSIFFQSTNSAAMSDVWADDFIVALYSSIAHLTMRNYKSRHSDSVPVPTSARKVRTFTVGDITAPNVDIDHPHFIALEALVPQGLFDMFFLPGFNCFHSSLRTLPWHDELDDPTQNQWSHVFNASETHRRKKDWVLSFYKPYRTTDGVDIWPMQHVDLSGLYLKQDTWDDGLEFAIAFGLIGSHRLEIASKDFAGESLAFVVRLNQYSNLETRPHFARYGGDLYFNQEGLPVVLETPDGRLVRRGDKDWQYWKFAWRSALITVITLVDHLHLAHFRVANVLSSAVRQTLSPNHPMRRFFSIFTFGSIFVNMNAMHTLVGAQHVLHRSSPFKDFESLSKLVPQSLSSPSTQHRSLVDAEAFERLPQKIKETPYFQDGRLLVVAIEKFVKSFLHIYRRDLCSAEDQISDVELQRFRDAIVREVEESNYRSPFSRTTNCTDMFDILVSYIWTVTGWHRHVGTVADYYSDPDMASFSWKEGEAFARPKQHMMMTTIAVFTGAAQPKLSEDYSHVLKGIDKEDLALKVLHDFRTDLRGVSAEIARRNDLRLATYGFRNVNADPDVVECSVAV